ncbi:MAG: hypothetical protein LC733_00180 [Actinobacteria bacterium]|nr:hypothetical protein [Actinomycetota bacterium]
MALNELFENQAAKMQPVAEAVTAQTRTRATSWVRPYAIGLAVADSAAVLLAAVMAQLARFGHLEVLQTDPLGYSYNLVAAVLAPAWVLTMMLGGAYERRHLGWGTEEYRRVFDSAVRFLALVAIIAFLFRADFARGFVAIAIPLATAFTLALRYALRQWMHRMRRYGRFTKKILVVGSLNATRELISKLDASASGLSVVAACIPGATGTLEVDGRSVAVVADPASVLEAALSSQADAIAVADETLSNGSLRRLAWELEGTGIDLMVAPVLTDVAGPRVSIRTVSDLPLLLIEEPELKGLSRVAKAVFDRSLAVAGLALLVPFLLVVGLLVRLTSPGPFGAACS